MHSMASLPKGVLDPVVSRHQAPAIQVFANGPLWRAARSAWQPFFKQASLGRVAGLACGLGAMT